MHTWDLNDLYQGFEGAYQEDLKRLDHLIDDYIEWIMGDSTNPIFYIEGYLKRSIELTKLTRGLFSYPSLVMSTDVTHQEAIKMMSSVQRIMRKATKENVIFQRYLESVDLDVLALTSPLIKNYLYSLKLDQKDASHLMSESEEVLYAKLRELSSGGWGQLQSLMTANLQIPFREKTVTLPEIRNMAYEQDADIRKEAYQAEIEAYSKVEDAVALALSNIKREVLMISELKKYETPLQKTLDQSRMTKKTLDAMLSVMMEYRSDFESYLKVKATYLGHKGALPFYDLFAPVGHLATTYTYEEAQKLILDSFAGFDASLSQFAHKAFQKNWIDVEPRKGKRGGAFCSNQPQIKQSRIMLNFTGSLSDVSTLAHELGHGYHGEMISENDPLHWSYPMPLAETASIFCETILNNYLLDWITDPMEKLAVLENSLQGDTQVIVDILSRYFFETTLFEKANAPISKDQMKAMMLDAQKKAYQEGLDHDCLHPFMWVNKPHYYSAGLNFYNFPYAFGLLFGKGLYAQYLKDPKGFVPKYQALLRETTKASVEACAKALHIDVTKPDFWRDSMNEIKKDIEEVKRLMQR